MTGLARKLSRHNPLAIGGTELPPQLLLLAKLLFVCLLADTGLRAMGYSQIAFLPALEHASDVLPREAWLSLFVISGTLLLFNVTPRAASLGCGALLIHALLISRLAYRNNLYFCACLFLLIGLSDRRSGGLLIRLQIIVLYFAAGLDKLAEPAWRDGTFFDAWQHQSTAYMFVSSQFAHLAAAKVLSWMTIVLEVGLAIGFAIPRTAVHAAWIGAAFHLSTVLAGGSMYGMFVIAAIGSYLSLLDIPDEIHVSVCRAKDWKAKMVRLLDRFDADDRIQVTWTTEPVDDRSDLSIHWRGQRYGGITAIQMLLLASPACYVLIAFVLGRFVFPIQVKAAFLCLLVASFFPYGKILGRSKPAN